MVATVTLVVSEVALSLILLVGAGLMIRTLWAPSSEQTPAFNPPAFSR